MLDSLVRVSRRDDKKHFVIVSLSTWLTFNQYMFESMSLSQGKVELSLYSNTASYRFTFSNFRHYFTLFSKFFSSFPHGTCLLSVSHQYFALDGVYHPLRAAIPNNSTHCHMNTSLLVDTRGSHPPWHSVPGDFINYCNSSYDSRRHFRRLHV